MAKSNKLLHPSGHYDKGTLLLSYCKWEFLRRNEDYRRDYKRVIKEYPKRHFPPEIYNYFQRKWGILFPADPVTNPTLTQIRKPAAYYKFKTALVPNFMKSEIVECLTRETIYSQILGKQKIIHFTEEELAKVTDINLKVNLLVHRTKILKEVYRIVKRWQDRRRKYDNLSPARFKDYKLYWKIYDIKIRKPDITFKKLAQKVYKLKPEEVRRDHEDRISKAYKTCCKLIDGGYRKISL